MSDGIESDTREIKEVVSESAFAELAQKVDQLTKRKKRRSKHFRRTKSRQMREYHARKRQLEELVIELERELEEARQKHVENNQKSTEQQDDTRPLKKPDFGYDEIFRGPQPGMMACFPGFPHIGTKDVYSLK